MERISAYRFFDQEVVGFSDGGALHWRVGDSPNKCGGCPPGTNGSDCEATFVFPVVVRSYAWVYTWPLAKGAPPAPNAPPITGPPPPPANVNGSWVGPVPWIYTDADCPNVGCHRELSVQQCEVLCDGVRGCDAFNFAPSPHVSSNLGGCCLRACPAKTSDGPPHSQPGISYYYHHPYLKTDDINADDSGRVNREYLHSDAAVSAAAVQTLTVYHIGPRNVSRATVPINMDSGSLRAEMYWDLGWKVEAVECANASAAPHLYASDCLRSGNNYLESQNSSNLEEWQSL